ncbi:MAG: tyrosine-type recombinase/integrase [Carboxydocellales bacterium]
MTKRQRRTNNLTQSFNVQMKQFLINCSQRNLTKNTIETYERHLSKFEKYLISIGNTTLVMDIDRIIVEEYTFSLKEVEKLNPNTINSVIRHLKSFFTYLHQHDTIEVNPMAKIQKLRIDEEPIKPFTDRQFAILLSQPDKSTFVGYRDFIIMSLLLGTGMRISELANITYNPAFATRQLIIGN